MDEKDSIYSIHIVDSMSNVPSISVLTTEKDSRLKLNKGDKKTQRALGLEYVFPIASLALTCENGDFKVRTYWKNKLATLTRLDSSMLGIGIERAKSITLFGRFIGKSSLLEPCSMVDR